VSGFSPSSWARLALIITLGILLLRSLRQQPLTAQDLRLRLPRCLVGLAMFGVGIAFLVDSKMGTAPWDVLHQGLATRLNIELGLVINIVGLLVLPLWIPLRQRIGLGTILNTLEIGMVLDLVKPYLPTPDALGFRLLMMTIGVLLIAIGSGVYIGSGLGPGPRDGIMTGLKALGMSVRMARTLVELTTLALGLLLGGTAGLGTVVFLFGIGPLVQVVLERVTLPPIAAADSQVRVGATAPAA
jgi:uncharacterized membrane protein YczE